MKLLLQIQEFFTCGNIVSKNNRSEASFRVNSLHDLINFIIPRGAARPLACLSLAASRCLQPGLPPAHFIKYPLLSQKGADFYLFKQMIELINTKVHLTEIGLLQIINIRASMNLGLSNSQKVEFTNYKPVSRPIINNIEISNPNWIAGFSSAEGCFLVNISKSNKVKVGRSINI